VLPFKNFAEPPVRSWTDDREAKYVEAMQDPYPRIGQKIRQAKFMNWPSEEWTKASYYFPRRNEVTEWGPFWRAGYGGWLHFAGEHTSYAFMGYMEGALSSGYRLAAKICGARQDFVSMTPKESWFQWNTSTPTWSGASWPLRP
jgi:monoamine oxidase